MRYSVRTGLSADFRVEYRWLHKKSDGTPQTQKPFQHLRCDFAYEGDDLSEAGIYMIWAEFEDAAGRVLPAA